MRSPLSAPLSAQSSPVVTLVTAGRLLDPHTGKYKARAPAGTQTLRPADAADLHPSGLATAAQALDGGVRPGGRRGTPHQACDPLLAQFHRFRRAEPAGLEAPLEP